jgi:GNAT superfamily N-acetyltransferase
VPVPDDPSGDGGPLRLATAADSESCAELCRSALEELADARGGALFTRRESGLVAKALLRPGGLERLIADRGRRVLVVTSGSEVVGLGIGRVDNVGEAAVGLVDACYVARDARRGGLGRALVEALVSWFDDTGCRGVDVPALPGDRATKSLLEAAGFKARLITMHRPLS